MAIPKHGLAILVGKMTGKSQDEDEVGAHDAADEGREDSGDELEMAMEDLSKAIQEEDYSAMSVAFRSAFEYLESQPHEEAEHEEAE